MDYHTIVERNDDRQCVVQEDIGFSKISDEKALFLRQATADIFLGQIQKRLVASGLNRTYVSLIVISGSGSSSSSGRSATVLMLFT